MGCVEVRSDEDVIVARQKVRQLAERMGFSLLETTRLITAVSELARNIVVHAKAGTVSFGTVTAGAKSGIRVIFDDHGPGIRDLEKAMQGGFSTVGSLGLGLSGAKRLVHEFAIRTEPGTGTTVEIAEWLP